MPESYLKLAIVTLRLTSVFYLGLIVFLLTFSYISLTLVGAVALGILLFLAVVPVILAMGLERRKRWAWIAAIVFFAIHLTSVGGIVVAVPGLWGLLAPGSRVEFGVA